MQGGCGVGRPGVHMSIYDSRKKLDNEEYTEINDTIDNMGWSFKKLAKEKVQDLVDGAVLPDDAQQSFGSAQLQTGRLLKAFSN